MNALCLACAFSWLFFSQQQLHTRNAPTNVEQRINALLAQMTLAEKLGQLQQLDGEANGNFRPEHLDLIRKGLLGSTLNVRGAQRTNQVQRVAMNESRLKIPVLFGFDVIHGYRTIFPIPLGEAAVGIRRWPSARPQLPLRKRNNSGCIGPSRRWSTSRATRVGAESPKARVKIRFSALLLPARACVVSRATTTAQLTKCSRARNIGLRMAPPKVAAITTPPKSPKTWLREIYFPPFKAAVDAGVGTLMSAFNAINGVPATANEFTLTKVLRQEWKFDGFVVSDYTSVKELINHGIVANEEDAAAAALNAGVEMEMVSRSYNAFGEKLLREKKLSMATIDEAVRRVLRIKFRLGLFDRPYTDETRESTALLRPESIRLSREIAGRSMVLLKNDRDTLPLNKNVKIDRGYWTARR